MGDGLVEMFDREFLNNLYKYCYALSGNEQEAYDLLQTSIEKYLKKDADKIDNSRSYLKRVIRNQYIDECRKNAKVIEDEFDDAVTYVDMDINSIEKIVANQREVEAVWQKLTVDEREIMYFWAVEGYTTSELVEVLDTSRGTLLSKIHRLRKRLEKNFSELCREDVI